MMVLLVRNGERYKRLLFRDVILYFVDQTLVEICSVLCTEGRSEGSHDEDACHQRHSKPRLGCRCR